MTFVLPEFVSRVRRRIMFSVIAEKSLVFPLSPESESPTGIIYVPVSPVKVISTFFPIPPAEFALFGISPLGISPDGIPEGTSPLGISPDGFCAPDTSDPDGLCLFPLKAPFEVWVSDEEELLEFSELEEGVSIFSACGIEDVEISPRANTTSFPIMDVTFPTIWVWFEESTVVVSVCAGLLKLLLSFVWV